MMLIRHLNEISGTERDVEDTRSCRLIVAENGLQYSVHITTLAAGARLQFEYGSHRETIYCIEGEGMIEDLTAEKQVDLGPGSLYPVGVGEPHIVIANTTMRLVSVFDPPLQGTEEAD